VTEEPRTVHGILVPSKSTLDRYGMTEMEWQDILEQQDWVCGVCCKVPPSGRLFIDHEHVRGWRKKSKEARRKYVRGLACYVCNRFVLNYRVYPQLLRAAAAYLEAYIARRMKEE
jgi:hypothetical protein